MSVRVRFAPSPTGNLHIGNARACIYNYLFAKKMGEKLILRVEDTDLERSKKEYEDSMVSNMKWLGVTFDEGPENPGDYGPYRQSERKEIYQKHADQLLNEGKAFYCFCSDEELEQMREKAIAEGRDPIYDGTWRDFPLEEAREKIAAGAKAVIRFKVPAKDYEFNDKVRGNVKFPEGMVGDFVIIRSNGMPTYNFCCVVDDALMKISHVIRGEDHLNNTVRQLMVYEAFGFTAPEFAHASLLIGEDRQKLSKRHGATSVIQYQEDCFLPQALSNYLCLLGWSHPDEKDVFTTEEVTEIFDLNRFNKAPALYDLKKLDWINGQHLKNLSYEEVLAHAYSSEELKSKLQNHSAEWQQTFIEIFLEKVQKVTELIEFYDFSLSKNIELGENEKEVLDWETTPAILSYLSSELKGIESDYVTSETLETWMNTLKKEHKIKGKPLFMGIRVCLTGACHGGDLKRLIPLIPRETLLERVSKLA